MTRRSTLADVAAAAGVSKMTASRALRGARDVSAASAEKVATAARALGYVGNHLAQSLSSHRADLIGVVVPGLSNIVFAEVLAGISEAIAGSGLQPVFGVSDYDPEREYEVVRGMLSWNPAGLIVAGLDQPAETRQLLAAADIPVVQIMDLDGAPVDACVGVSQREAGRAMAFALAAAGRRQVGYVGCGLERDTRAKKRFDGFAAGLTEAGLSLVDRAVAEGGSTARAGRALTEELLARHPGLDCIYYSNDDVAMGGAFHCMASGIATPEALLLAGFNGLEIVDSLPVRIATSRTPRREIGAAAARIVMDVCRTGEGRSGRRVAYVPAIDLGC